MADEIKLGPEETVPGRPFTDPVHSRNEERALRELLGHERERARRWDGEPGVVLSENDQDELRHLLVVPDTGRLLDAENPTVVGFFGRPREDADIPLLFDLEEELVAGMGDYAQRGLLSYYDVELVKGAYGNLILFESPAGLERWRENPVHRRAVEISPSNYHEIRLHQGRLEGRLLDGGTLHLLRTRYLDYSGPEVWRAVRPVLDPGRGG